MSKSKRYRAAGRPWKTINGTLVTIPFPGAKTVEDIGRIILENKSKRYHWLYNTISHRHQQLLRDLRKTCFGREYYRKIWCR